MDTATFKHHCDNIGGLRTAAAIIGKTHSTIQRYYNGTAKVPDDYAAKIESISHGVSSFMAALPSTISAIVAKDFPQGIPSERSE